MASKGGVVEPEQGIVLDAPPSCLEFSPLNQEYFVVGTYSLESGNHADVAREDSSDGAIDNRTQSRSGILVLFNLERDKLYAPNSTSVIASVYVQKYLHSLSTSL